MSENNDELVKAQNELIGILFEIIKRFQANNRLRRRILSTNYLVKE